MAEQTTQRLFFALWPDASVRSDLQQCLSLMADAPGRLVVPDNLHLTLAFPGQVDAATQACLEGAADSIRVTPFDIRLNRFGFWKHPRVVWYGPDSVPPELLHLAAELERSMRDCGLTPDARPYRPHVTLLRKALGEPEAVAPEMVWRAEGFVLVLSESSPQGVRYRVIRRWEFNP
jgi:RNA 2',3'-cyclic 3'-phosphodiesterase